MFNLTKYLSTVLEPENWKKYQGKSILFKPFSTNKEDHDMNTKK